jgi:hypothetical protein
MVLVSTTHMADDPEVPGADAPTAVPTGSEAAVEAYQTDDGVVLYDAGNPLAWIESHAPVPLDDAV